MPSPHHPPPSVDSHGCTDDQADENDAAESPDPPIIIIIVSSLGVAVGGLVGVHAICVIVAAVGRAQTGDTSPVHFRGKSGLTVLRDLFD